MNPLLGWCLKLLGFVIGAGAVFVGTKYYKMKHDSAIEEHIEQKIKEQTGIDMDITYDSAEFEPEEKIPTLLDKYPNTDKRLQTMKY